jgi:hypothetical protein
MTRSDGGDRQPIAIAAKALTILSKALGETIRVLAAVEGNSRNAALLRWGLDRSPRRWLPNVLAARLWSS